MLEQLARDVTGWPARAVEFFEQLATTQYMNHVRLHAPATADLRSTPRDAAAWAAPFNAVAHTAEMRRPESGAGRYNIPNIGIFLWRLQPLRLSDVPLTPDPGDASGRKFRFNPLGADLPLFRRAGDRRRRSAHHRRAGQCAGPAVDVRLMALASGAQAAPRPTPTRGSTTTTARARAWCCRARTPIRRSRRCRSSARSASAICAICSTAAALSRLEPRGRRARRTRSASIRERGRVLLGATVQTGRSLGHASTTASRAPIGGGEYERSPPGDDRWRRSSAARRRRGAAAASRRDRRRRPARSSKTA